MRRVAAIVVCAALMAGACGRRPRAQHPVSRAIGWTQTGMASWYGHPYHGRRAANGEIYDMEKMTAAHNTLPFGTWVRVRNLENGKTVDLRITDRGPFKKRRIIDVSRAGASGLDMIGPGTARVRIQVIRAPDNVKASFFAVQAGVFEDRRNAGRLRDRLARRFGNAKLVMRQGDRTAWRVLVGKEMSEEEAQALAERVRREFNGEAANAFVVRLDSGES
ncbi:MAG: septal ring lytic transglycosylase RlpA family protein [Bryobacteraceae bacterium]